MRTRAAIAIAAVAAVAGIAQAATDGGDVNEVGPATRIQPNGRRLGPIGKLTQLGNHPGGGTVTPDGRYLWAVSSGRGRNDIRIVRVNPGPHCHGGPRGAICKHKRSVRIGKPIQTIPMPGAPGGIAMAPDGRTAYVSGSAESEHKDQQTPKDTPGKQGDVIHVFHYDPVKGTATRDGLIEVPPPGDAPIAQDFPPSTAKLSWPRDLAVSPDGKTLLAALNLADRAAIVDTKDRSVRYVATGSYPYGAGITRDGKYGLVSNESDGTVSVIDLAAGTKVKDVQVGPHLSHPEAIATDPTRDRAYVAVTHQDLVAVIDTKTLTVERTLSVARPEGNGTAPTDVSVTGDGKRLLVADSGEDAVAVFATSGDLPLIGRIPVAAYPVMAESPRRERLVWVSAKGLGVGPNPHGPNPYSPSNNDDHINDFGYLPSIVTGTSGVLSFPSDRRIRKYTPLAERQVRPVNAEQPPAGTPIDPNAGKIEHVFYIVKENRTYDQVLGDDPRGDGDPKLELFPEKVTPNIHALARRFPLVDHVFANSEASIDGHFWTSAAAVSDYVTKNWHQNYAARGRPYDFGVYSVTWPSQRFLFDQAEREGISYFNYGEAIAGTVPLADKDRTPEETAQVEAKFQKSDLGAPNGCFPNDASSGGLDSVLQGDRTGIEIYDSSKPAGARPDAESRFDCFRNRFLTQAALGQVPAFSYITLTNDHTSGTTPGRRSPTAMVADNDLAVGQIVDVVSHSPVWQKSLILVVEDDSQDGADHLDAHRIPALVISPYARRGAVVHTRYDFASFIRTLELAIGMKPLNLFDAMATPLYDAFSPAPDNAEPYSAVGPNVDLLERNTAASPGAAASARLDLDTPDRVPQRVLDRILWQHVHGAGSNPPPPGPNASAEDDEP